MKFFSLPLMVTILLLASGCAMDSSRARLLQSRVADPASETRQFVISRKVFTEALRNEEANGPFRLVQTFRGVNQSESALQEYRVFGVRDEGVYALLGLRNADILLSAQGYEILAPVSFGRYVAALASVPESYIEIRRNGIPLILKFTFLE